MPASALIKGNYREPHPHGAPHT